MKPICTAMYPPGCEATARRQVAQERAEGRYVEVQVENGTWIVSVWLLSPDLTLTPAAPEWL